MVYILTFDGEVERASCDQEKITALSVHGNGFDSAGNAKVGPYAHFAMELEDLDKGDQGDYSNHMPDSRAGYNALCDLLEWAKGNRGRRDINPYGVPEVRAALEHLAKLQGITSYLDAVTK